MKRKKIAALMIAFSLALCGCNTITGSPEVSSEVEPSSESDTSSVTTAAAVEETPEASSETEETSSENDNKTTGEQTTEKTSDTTEESETESAEDTTKTEDSETDSETTPAETSKTALISVTSPPPKTVPTSSAAKTTETRVETAPPVTTTEPPATTTAVPAAPSPATVLTPVADGVLTSGNALATIDYSHTSDGYVMAKYTGTVGKIKVRITGPTGVSQIYNLNSDGKFESYPLTASDGSYTVDVLESVGAGYAFAHTYTFNVTLSSALAPFLRPSQYVNYSLGDSAVTLASQLCAGTSTPLEKVDKIYSWLVDNVVYDYDFAASTIAGGYAGDTEKVVNQKKGICLDYAATMAAMLRSQNVPTQVISGDVNGGGFHAWVNVYVQDVGWVYGGAIYFDGSAWHRMDPTYAASSHSNQDILDFIANGSNYVQDYVF